jgi:hypothetical protein
MSTTAPSDEAWAALLTQVAELQVKIATLESAAEVDRLHIRALEDDLTGLDELFTLEKRLYESFEEIARRLSVSLFTIWDGQAGRREP